MVSDHLSRYNASCHMMRACPSGYEVANMCVLGLTALNAPYCTVLYCYRAELYRTVGEGVTVILPSRGCAVRTSKARAHNSPFPNRSRAHGSLHLNAHTLGAIKDSLSLDTLLCTLASISLDPTSCCVPVTDLLFTPPGERGFSPTFCRSRPCPGAPQNPISALHLSSLFFWEGKPP